MTDAHRINRMGLSYPGIRTQTGYRAGRMATILRTCLAGLGLPRPAFLQPEVGHKPMTPQPIRIHELPAKNGTYSQAVRLGDLMIACPGSRRRQPLSVVLN